MDAYRLLGIGRDADERQIKRAYAALLKNTRPDEDPAGFQRLNEAYQQALAYCRDRMFATVDTDGDVGPADDAPDDALSLRLTPEALARLMQPPSEQADAFESAPAPVPPAELPPSPTPPPVDVHTLARDVLACAQTESPTRLADWLAAHDGLYLLAAKHRVGHAVLERICAEELPLRAQAMQVLGDFFDFSPPEWLARREQVRRAVESGRTEMFDEARPVAIRQLKRRFVLPQALLMSCVPGLAQRITSLSNRLEYEYGETVPGLDERQQRFFAQIADPFYFGLGRWAGIVLTGVFAMLLVAAMGLGAGTAPERIVRIAGYAFVGSAGLLLMWHAMRGMWAMRETPPEGRTWVRALLPAWLALAALVVAFALPQLPALAFALAMPAALLYFQRFFDALRFGLGTAWLSTLLPDAMAPSEWLMGVIGVGVGMTLSDVAYAYRHRVPVQAAVGNRATMIASYVYFGASILIALIF